MYPDAVGDLAFFLASADSWTFIDTPIRNSRSAKNLENISLTTDSISSTLNITEKAAVTWNNSITETSYINNTILNYMYSINKAIWSIFSHTK